MRIARHLTLLTTLACLACSGYAKNTSIDDARDAVRKGDWTLAMQLAQKSLSADPGNADALALQGEYHWANGDSARAAESFEKALRNNAKQTTAILTLTQYYIQNKRLDDAERIVANAEEKDLKGKVDEIRAARGMLSAAKDDFAGATKVLVSLATKKPDNPLYPTLLARLYNGKGVKEQAEQYYEAAFKLNPGDMDLAYEYALVLQALEQDTKALEMLKVVQENSQDNKQVDYLIGRLYFTYRRWADAAENLEMAVEKRPDHFLSQYLYGKALLERAKAEKLNLYRRAEGPLRVAVELRPERTDAQEALQECLDFQGRLALQSALTDSTGTKVTAYCDTALVYFKDLAKVNPAFKGVYANMARVFTKQANLDSTAYYCRKELEYHPEDSATLTRLVNALQRTSDHKGLVDVLKPIFDKQDWMAAKPAEGVSPQSEFIGKFGGILANSLQETSQSGMARELLNTMLAYQPDWKDGHTLNAFLDLRKNNYAGAIPVLQKAVDALPRDPELWVMLGDAWYFSNPKNKADVLKAKDCYQRAMQLGSRDGADKFQKLGSVK